MAEIEQNSSLINLKFLADPLTKLAETVKDVVSIYAEPKKAIRMAKAEVEIDRIKAFGKLDIDEAVAQRIGQRLLNQEVRRQENIDSITQQAAVLLPYSVSEEPVNTDWTTSFFENCQDISDKEMQVLWAKILAGEVERPRSYSLRTLQTLKLMSKEDADLFHKFCNYVWNIVGVYSYLYTAETESFLKTKDIKYGEIQHLNTIGLLSEPTVFSLDSEIDTLTFLYGKDEYDFQLINSDKKSSLPEFSLTNVAVELARLRNFQPDEEYLSILISSLKKRNIRVFLAPTDKYSDFLPRITCRRD